MVLEESEASAKAAKPPGDGGDFVEGYAKKWLANNVDDGLQAAQQYAHDRTFGGVSVTPTENAQAAETAQAHVAEELDTVAAEEGAMTADAWDRVGPYVKLAAAYFASSWTSSVATPPKGSVAPKISPPVRAVPGAAPAGPLKNPSGTTAEMAAKARTHNPSPSPEVQKALRMIKDSGAKVQQNPKNPALKQEGNVTLDYGSGSRVNVRVETHPLSKDGPPKRHANVEVVETVKNKSRVKKNVHIEE